MMEKDELRKADIFSGGIIFLFGLWVVSQALQMPMKGSWGGVMNVWFVSPALFPLLVGGMIAFLGLLLIRTAFKAVGRDAFLEVLRWLASPALWRFLRSAPTVRFYAMVVLFFSYVFVQIPRIDFFLCSVFFLMAFIGMFYADDDELLVRLFGFYVGGTLLLTAFFALGVAAALADKLPYPGDWLTLILILSYGLFAWRLVRGDAVLRRRYRLSLVLALAGPFTVGPIFKYLLLVPMPFEGIVVAVMDALRYWEF